LHWNGKSWSAIAAPAAFSSVSTSSPNNAWAVSGYDMYHWNGKAWSEDGAAPVGVQLNAVTTDSPTHAYAVGIVTTTSLYSPIIMRFNGSTWSRATLPKAVPHLELWYVTTQGSSVWAVSNGRGAVILHSSGGPWKIQALLPSSYFLSGISAESASRAYAAGGVPVNGYNKTFLDSYNGHSWKGVSSKL
jgi:hypothetical protein